ncbi:hypothetical protein HPB47_022731, partial [Ixodes persulcatus]
MAQSDGGGADEGPADGPVKGSTENLRRGFLFVPGNGSGLRRDEDSAATEDRLPRHLWRTCTIKETFMGRDGRVRSCRILLPGGAELKRP